MTRRPSADERWPGYPPASNPYAGPDPYASPDPYANPDPYAGPYPGAPQPGPPAPGYAPPPTPPYGSAGPAASAYDGPSYGSNPYEVNPYEVNPYEVNPYQPGYGSYSPYGTVPANHPRATSAMVLGIVSIVLASSCGIGGLLGIVGIVQGRKVRSEIDAQPGRYAGRSMASAGIITGTIGVVLGALVTIGVIFAFAIGAGA